MTDFDKNLETGKVGESLIAEWLKKRGRHIMPVYEVVAGQYKGPSVYSSSGESIIAPDMLVFGKEKTTWIEAKHKSAFSWHRNSEQIHEKPWVTGIDLHHYEQYQRIMEISDWPVWLLFLHQMGSAKKRQRAGFPWCCSLLRERHQVRQQGSLHRRQGRG